jgi:hypothetical protein
MGGSVNTGGQNQNQTSVTTPWAPAAGTVQGLLGQLSTANTSLTPAESQALGQLTSLGQQGNQFAPAIGNVASTLLSGGGANNQGGLINNAYEQYQQQLNPYLQSSFLDPRNTPGFGDALNAVNSDITNQINGQFAAAGRDLSGMNGPRLEPGRRAAHLKSVQSERPESARRCGLALRRGQHHRRAAHGAQSAVWCWRGRRGQYGASLWPAARAPGAGTSARDPAANAGRRDGHRASRWTGVRRDEPDRTDTEHNATLAKHPRRCRWRRRHPRRYGRVWEEWLAEFWQGLMNNGIASRFAQTQWHAGRPAR